MLDILAEVLDRGVFGNWIALATILAAGLLARSGRTLPATRVLRLFSWPVAVGASAAAALSLAAALFVYAGRGEPLPRVPDDSSHLLLADTLLHGRLANPPHPFGRHLQGMLTLDRPTYASPYPPGNGVALAFGSLVFGLPIAGIWIFSAAAAAAVVWATRAWMSRSWSVIAGLIVAIHPTVTNWNTVYNGGSVPLLGGALLLGATGRLIRSPTARIACVAALGIIVLANSRLYEGMLFAIAMVPLVLIANHRAVPAILRVSAPAIAILAIGAISIAVFNDAVTGNPFEVPHARFDRLYNPHPNFLWQKEKPDAVFLTEEARLVSAPYLPHHLRLREPGGVRRLLWDKVVLMAYTITAPEVEGTVLGTGRLLLFLPPLFALGVLRRRYALALLAALIVFLFAPLTTTWWLQRHYVAPAGALVAVLYLLLARRSLAAARGRAGWILIVALLVVFSASTAVVVGMSHQPEIARQREQWERDRREIARRLERMGGQHLILVAPSIPGIVYNGADLEGSPVLWARQIDATSDAALLHHYARRKAWLLVASNGRLAVRPLSSSP